MMTAKGFGFITAEDGKDLFFHATSCNGAYDSFREGQQVSFDLEQSDKGPRAVNLVATA